MLLSAIFVITWIVYKMSCAPRAARTARSTLVEFENCDIPAKAIELRKYKRKASLVSTKLQKFIRSHYDKFIHHARYGVECHSGKCHIRMLDREPSRLPYRRIVHLSANSRKLKAIVRKYILATKVALKKGLAHSANCSN